MLRTGAMPQMNQQAGTYYVYPQMLDYLKRADVISVQIGSNDALVPALVALGNATNWKSEQLVATMVSGVLREPSFENLQRLNSDLSRLRLTKEEKQATTQLLLGGGTDAICEQAYQEAAVNMPQVVAQLRALNPDAQIILVGYTNPVPLLPEWTQLFRRLNALSKSLAAQNENVTYVPIPFAMTATDAHPTVSGHKYIANRILREGESAVRDYKKFLSGGCSKEPVELLRDMGVDMRTPAPVNDALSLFGELIDELSALLG